MKSKDLIKVLRLSWSTYKLNKSSKRLKMERSLTKYIKEHNEVNIFNYFIYRIIWKLGGRLK